MGLGSAASTGAAQLERESAGRLLRVTGVVKHFAGALDGVCGTVERRPSTPCHGRDGTLRRVRWGVLGWGAIARRAFVPALAKSSSGQLVAVASERGDAGALPARGHAGEGAYEALLRSDDIDAVYIATPNHRHAELTEAAAAAGKHVLCEKPLGTSADEALGMAERCAAAGVLLMEAMMARFNPQHARVRQLIAAGAIGEPRLFRGTFTVKLADPTANIRLMSAPGSGALFDLGIYPISVARWILAAEPTDVVSSSLPYPGTTADELSGVLMRFPHERLAVIDCGLTVEARNHYDLVGSDGTISVTRPFASPPFVPAEPALEIVVTRGDDVEVERFEDGDQYALQLEAFHRALTGAAAHPYPPRESIATARVIDACHTTGRVEHCLR